MAVRQEKGIANGTVNRELALLRRSFNLARMTTPPKVAKVPFIPTLEENNVRSASLKTPNTTLQAEAPTTCAPVLAFAYYTGCRRGEILSLRSAGGSGPPNRPPRTRHDQKR
ncbi:MAG: hypothetical protein U0Q18_00350 [Bryobacteraceae bacterium]